MKHFEVAVITTGAEAEFVFADHTLLNLESSNVTLCTVRFRKFATGEEASKYGRQALDLLVGADQYSVVEIDPGKMVKSTVIYRSVQPAREREAATVEPGPEPETKTLPLAEGEEDNAKYRLRNGTRTGCKVLYENDLPTEADIHNY